MAGFMHIKKNDIVQVMSGSDATAHKTGKVLQVLPAKGRAVVEGINYVKKTIRKNQDNPQGAIVDKEGSVSISNLLLYCPRCKKGVRTSKARSSAGKRSRKCRKCEHGFDE